MLKILSQYSGAQKATFLVGERKGEFAGLPIFILDALGDPMAGVQVSISYLEQKKLDVHVGAINDETWKSIPKLFVQKILARQEPILGKLASSTLSP